MMTPVLFQAPFQARSSWGWKSKRWDESSAVRGGGGEEEVGEKERKKKIKNDKKSRYYVSILGLRGVSELPWIAIPRSFIPI